MEYLSWDPVYFCSAQGSPPTCCPTFYYGALVLKNCKQMYHRIHAVAAQHCRLVHKRLPLEMTDDRKWQFSLEPRRVRSRISWNPQLQGPFQNILLHTQEQSSWLPEPGRLVQDILTQFLLLPSRQVGWGQLSVGCTDQPDQMDVGRHYTKKIFALYCQA